MTLENFTHSFEPFSDLKSILPSVAEALGVNVDDLEILNDGMVSCEYMMARKYQDRAIQKISFPGLPFIQTRAMHAPASYPCGCGVVIYEARNNPDLRYGFFETAYNCNYSYRVFIVPKKSVFRLMRHANRLSQQISDKCPPILEDGILQCIIDNTVGFLLHQKDIEQYGVKIRRGIILSGQPGNGKSMVCRWIQKICRDKNIDFGVIGGSEIERVFAEGHKLDDLFSRFPVTFFDDIDINYLNRRKGDGKIACAILSSMDGVFQSDHTVRIFTTNEDLIDIDEAFRRPGRIDRCFNLNPPNWKLRSRLVLERWPSEILEYLEGKMDTLLNKSEGFSFAEMESIRSLLVTNKLMGTGKWDLNLAFKEYDEGRETFSKQRIYDKFGFSIRDKSGDQSKI
jgi:cell division protease FtsH